jgi:hypothetical protein
MHCLGLAGLLLAARGLNPRAARLACFGLNSGGERATGNVMNPKSLPIVRLTALGFLLFARGALAAFLYDAALGTLPEAQGWGFAIPPGCSQSVGGGVLNLDTTSDSALRAGYFRFDQVLDSAAGVRLSFSAQLLTEVHASDDRAGFSVILLDSASRGIELGFWTDRIWAQRGPTFEQAERYAISTDSLIDYSLELQRGSYTLSAGGTPILTGPLRDYSSSGFPYDVKNFIFFGDDTTSARASVDLTAISISAVPEPGVPAGRARAAGRNAAGNSPKLQRFSRFAHRVRPGRADLGRSPVGGPVAQHGARASEL